MKKFTLLFLLLAVSLQAAVTDFYVQTTGSNLNAGSTATDAAAFTYTNKVQAGSWNSGTGVFTVASGSPSTDGVSVGNYASLYVTAGATVSAAVAQITARTTTTITVSLTNRSGLFPANDATGATTLKVGGAWAGPSGTVSFPFNFVTSTMTPSSALRINIKGGTDYAMTGTLTANSASATWFEGYTSSPHDGGKATINGGSSGASYILFNVGASSLTFQNLIFTGNGLTGSAVGIQNTANSRVCFIGCRVTSMTDIAISSSGGDLSLIECEFDHNNENAAGNQLQLNSSSYLTRCYIHDGGTVSSNASHQVFIGCIFDTLSNGTHGAVEYSSSTGQDFRNCEFYNNANSGIKGLAASGQFLIENCNFTNNGAYGIDLGATNNNSVRILNCGFGSGTAANTSGQTSSTDYYWMSGIVTYASGLTPWVDPANGNFTLLPIIAWALGRGIFPGTTSTTGYPDIGASQHRDQPRPLVLGGNK